RAQVGEEVELLAQAEEPTLGALLLVQVVPLGAALRFSWCRLSHLGPPTEPNRMASLRSQRARVAAGNGSPVASMAAPPTRADSNSKEAPEARPTTSSTLRASGITSCPIPSPGRTAILWVGILDSLLDDLCLLHPPACPQGPGGATEQVQGEE